jgi:hypothetical protein
MGWAAAEEAQESAAPAAPHPRTATYMPCGKRTDVVKMLRESFGETQIAQGLANTGSVAEVFISSKGTWTIVATSPNGLSCLIGAGESWQAKIAQDGTI